MRRIPRFMSNRIFLVAMARSTLFRDRLFRSYSGHSYVPLRLRPFENKILSVKEPINTIAQA